MSLLNRIAWTLLIIGGIDSGIYGLLGFHLFEIIFGHRFLGRLVFVLVGVSASYFIYMVVKKKKIVM